MVRRKDRIRLPDTADSRAPAYWFESLDFPVPNRPIQSYFAEFEGASEPHQHAGVELVFVLSGRLEVGVGAAVHELGEGDAIYFEPSTPHSYRRLGSRKTTAVVVTSAAPAPRG